MIRCPVRQAEHPENTIFGDEYAFYQGGSGAETDPMATHEAMGSWMEREKTKVSEEEVVFPVSLKLKLSVSGSRREMELPLIKEEVTIGRLDPASNSFPEVDLASHSGLKKGVSRWHAKIIRSGNEVLIEDLASTNGTLLNRRRLTPCFPQVLKSGDELQLGRLTLRVSFQ